MRKNEIYIETIIIENDGNALPRVVFYAGGVKVLIPFSEMGFDLNPDEVDAREAGRKSFADKSACQKGAFFSQRGKAAALTKEVPDGCIYIFYR